MLKAGDRVIKVGGSFAASGVIVAAFQNTMGEQRYVMEFDEPKGMLHIYTGAQLKLHGPSAEYKTCSQCGARHGPVMSLDEMLKGEKA